MILKFCDICGKVIPAGKSAGYFNKDLGSFDFCEECVETSLPEDSKLLQTILTNRSIDLLKEHMKNSIEDAKLTNKPYVRKEEFDVFSSNIRREE